MILYALGAGVVMLLAVVSAAYVLEAIMRKSEAAKERRAAEIERKWRESVAVLRNKRNDGGQEL